MRSLGLGVQRSECRTERSNLYLYASVRLPGSEILTASASELFWPEAPSRIYCAWHAKMKIDSKILLAEGQHALNFLRKYTRVLPQPMMGTTTYLIYADRMAFVLWKKKQVLLLRNAQIVDLFKEQFLYLWPLAQKI